MEYTFKFLGLNYISLVSFSELSIQFGSDSETIKKILQLQKLNLRQNLQPEEIISQGFVYVEHDPEILQKICLAEPAVIAMAGDQLAGYALCMNKQFGNMVPELVALFENLDSIKFHGEKLKNSNYLACGQICIAKAYRGRNLMGTLYHKMKTLNRKYKYCVTEISTHNIRSLNAHYKVGFVPIQEHVNDLGEHWQIVIWDWSV